MIEELLPNVDWEEMIEATYETLYMTGISICGNFHIRNYPWSGVIFNVKGKHMGKSPG